MSSEQEQQLLQEQMRVDHPESQPPEAAEIRHLAEQLQVRATTDPNRYRSDIAAFLSHMNTPQVPPQQPPPQVLPPPQTFKFAPRIPNPPEYDGTRSQAEDWIFNLRQYFGLVELGGTHLSDHYKISFAANLFRKEAMNWYRTSTATWFNTPMTTRETFHSFEDFVAKFLKRFQPIRAKQIARDKLAALVQTGSVEKYTEQFQNISAAIDDLSEAEALDKYIRGLKQHVSDWLKAAKVQESGDLQQAMVMAQAVGTKGPVDTRPYDPMMIDPPSLNGMSTRRPKDRRPIVHANMQDRWPPTQRSGNGMHSRSPSRERYGRPRSPYQPREEQERLREENRCFLCKEVGHMIRDCPLNKRVTFASHQSGRGRGRW